MVHGVVPDAGLSDTDPDVRYDACLRAAKSSDVDSADIVTLIGLLLDRALGTEYWNRGAGSEPVHLPIAHAAAAALRAHARRHREVVARALREASAALRAAMVAVLPSDPPHAEIVALASDDVPAVRLAAVERLDEIQFDALLPFWSEPFSPSPEFEARASQLSEVFRALTAAMHDEDASVARRAARCVPGNRTDPRGDGARAVCIGRAGAG